MGTRDRVRLENTRISRTFRSGTPSEDVTFANQEHTIVIEGNPHDVTEQDIGLTVVRTDVNSDTTLTDERWVSVDAGANTVDITLPTSPYDAQRISIKAVDATFDIGIVGSIDGTSNMNLYQGEVVDLMWSDTESTWEVRP